MCFTTVYRSTEGTHAVPATVPLPKAFCIFGEHCHTMGHSRVIYQWVSNDSAHEGCPACCPQAVYIAHWAHQVSEAATGAVTTVIRPQYRAPRDIEAVSKTAEIELTKILEEVEEYRECEALLHYLLTLPEDSVKKWRMFELYGTKLGERATRQQRMLLRALAAQHDAEGKLVFFINGVMLGPDE